MSKRNVEINKVYLTMIDEIFSSNVFYELNKTEKLRLTGIKEDAIAGKKLSNKQRNVVSNHWGLIP